MDPKHINDSVIYLDNNATTPLAEEVIIGITQSLAADWGNPSSNNQYGTKARGAVYKARVQIASMLSCTPNEIIFTSGGTEANNVIINSAVQYFDQYKETYNKGNEKAHIITTNVEHDSVILPIQHLQERRIITSTVVEVMTNFAAAGPRLPFGMSHLTKHVNKKGCVNVEDILSKITPQTCLITVMYAQNETGVIMPIPEIGSQLNLVNERRESLKLPKVFFHTDAAQIIGKEKINFYDSKSHFMTVVGHKFHGPRIGCICAREKIFPLFFGGGQEAGIRPGTENTPMIVGLGIAAQLVADNIESYKAHLLSCRERLETKLKQVFGNDVQINCGETERLPNTCSISFKGERLEGCLILHYCKKVVASVGAACHGAQCSDVLISSGIAVDLARNSIRLSVGRFTTLQEIDEAVLDLENAVREVRKLASSSSF